jgi:hypothetical protein
MKKSIPSKQGLVYGNGITHPGIPRLIDEWSEIVTVLAWA